MLNLEKIWKIWRVGSYVKGTKSTRKVSSGYIWYTLSSVEIHLKWVYVSIPLYLSFHHSALITQKLPWNKEQAVTTLKKKSPLPDYGKEPQSEAGSVLASWVTGNKFIQSAG